MAQRSINLTSRLHEYLLSVSLRESPELAALRAVSDRQPGAGMRSSVESAQFMALLAELIDARRVIEVGVFTGYTTLALAQAMADDGLIVACDVDNTNPAIGRQAWKKAGVADRIDLRIAPATETLQALIDDGQAATFDMAFIDADKTNYVTYYEQCLTLVRPGGVVLVDNVLWGGKVADPQIEDESTLAIRDLNRRIAGDERVSVSLLPIGDGLTLARRQK